MHGSCNTGASFPGALPLYFCIINISFRRIYLDTSWESFELYGHPSLSTIMHVAFPRDDHGHDNDPSWTDRDVMQFNEAPLDQQGTQWLHSRVELLQDVGRHHDAIALEDEFILG
ncbi:MAG: hypothetical protein CBB80_008365 [Synechococcus sp. TMED20]|nr:MAG: hypothetical protein CBB80_008365 [Synechococcus sp. TMED20]